MVRDDGVLAAETGPRKSLTRDAHKTICGRMHSIWAMTIDLPESRIQRHNRGWWETLEPAHVSLLMPLHHVQNHARKVQPVKTTRETCMNLGLQVTRSTADM